MYNTHRSGHFSVPACVVSTGGRETVEEDDKDHPTSRPPLHSYARVLLSVFVVFVVFVVVDIVVVLDRAGTRFIMGSTLDRVTGIL